MSTDWVARGISLGDFVLTAVGGTVAVLTYRRSRSRITVRAYSQQLVHKCDDQKPGKISDVSVVDVVTHNKSLSLDRVSFSVPLYEKGAPLVTSGVDAKEFGWSETVIDELGFQNAQLPQPLAPGITHRFAYYVRFVDQEWVTYPKDEDDNPCPVWVHVVLGFSDATTKECDYVATLQPRTFKHEAWNQERYDKYVEEMKRRFRRAPS